VAPRPGRGSRRCRGQRLRAAPSEKARVDVRNRQRQTSRFHLMETSERVAASIVVGHTPWIDVTSIIPQFDRYPLTEPGRNVPEYVNHVFSGQVAFVPCTDAPRGIDVSPTIARAELSESVNLFEYCTLPVPVYARRIFHPVEPNI
jgi:hypothetical protein